jgi:hypothetical protein
VKIIKDFVAKPLSKEEVVETIQRVYRQSLINTGERHLP